MTQRARKSGPKTGEARESIDATEAGGSVDAAEARESADAAEASESDRVIRERGRGKRDLGSVPFETRLMAMQSGGDLQIWETLTRWRAEGRRFALLTVIDTRGFTPRKAGAHMLVAADGEIFSTIGGGAIENEVIAEAKAMLESGTMSVTVQRHLTQELGMCCGGEMSVFVEAIEVAPRLTVFGAGYIAKPLVAIAAGCGFRVRVVDERPDWANPERFPSAQVHCRAPAELLRELDLDPAEYVVVVTHDHALDQRLVQDLLKRPLRFVGMIGSVPKQRKFALRLRARGFTDEEIARLHTPLGVSIGASTPEEIAVSVMAELIAVRRGQPVGWEWTPPAAIREVKPK